MKYNFFILKLINKLFYFKNVKYRIAQTFLLTTLRTLEKLVFKLDF